MSRACTTVGWGVAVLVVTLGCHVDSTESSEMETIAQELSLEGTAFTAMSFNVRFPHFDDDCAADGVDRGWNRRKSEVLGLVLGQRPDIVGFQELTHISEEIATCVYCPSCPPCQPVVDNFSLTSNRRRCDTLTNTWYATNAQGFLEYKCSVPACPTEPAADVRAALEGSEGGYTCLAAAGSSPKLICFNHAKFEVLATLDQSSALAGKGPYNNTVYLPPYWSEPARDRHESPGGSNKCSDVGMHPTLGQARSSSMAALRHLETGKTLLVVNSHFHSGSEGADEKVRIRQSRCLASWIEWALSPTGIAPSAGLISLGDFNMRNTRESYVALTREIGPPSHRISFVDPGYPLHATFNNFNFSIPNGALPSGSPIDHMFVRGLHASSLRILNDRYTRINHAGNVVYEWPSDHCPIMADFVFTNDPLYSQHATDSTQPIGILF